MANEAQLKFLKKKGVEAWNNWRLANPKIRPDLCEVNLNEIDLRNIDLHDASLIGVNLSRTDLRNAFLRGANLLQANLSQANLSGTNLSGAILDRVQFRRTNLCGADLSGAEAEETIFMEASLSETEFSNCVMGWTWLANINLSGCKGLERVRHHNPSIVSIDTIYRSGGNIPEVFLRKAGVPEPFIVHMKSLVAAMSPIEFYSCFISYSSKDQEFAERLYADLQSMGVRCWFAPEDLKIGDKLRPAFDEAIRVHDKLMVLLSKNSVGSPWVEKEVETAFEKERQQSRTVLFPIRLDEAVMETDQAWAADIRRTRHIGDFRDWKNHDSYRKALDRLLRDLKAV